MSRAGAPARYDRYYERMLLKAFWHEQSLPGTAVCECVRTLLPVLCSAAAGLSAGVADCSYDAKMVVTRAVVIALCPVCVRVVGVDM